MWLDTNFFRIEFDQKSNRKDNQDASENENNVTLHPAFLVCIAVTHANIVEM